MSVYDPKRTSKRSFPRALAATARSRREVGLAHRFLKLKLEPAPATIPAATEENQHYQDDDEEGGGVHVALPGASVPYGLHSLTSIGACRLDELWCRTGLGSRPTRPIAEPTLG
jgi:hypothetical protein